MSGESEHCRRKAILSKHSHGANCAGPRQQQAFRNLSIRMVAGACNHPNLLVPLFGLELIRFAA
jgi:hypothetical protein